jgi:transposase InsO family protein
MGIDDRSRVGVGKMFDDDRKHSAVAFLDYALAYYRLLGVRIRQVMTDNAKIFHSKLFATACARAKLRHVFTKPYTPQTNGKAGRFIQVARRECFYGRVYRHSRERTAYFPEWLHRYNWHRPHAALGGHPPISRLQLAGDNLMRLHS